MKIRARELLKTWGRLLRGSTPMLSIDVTRSCPLRCPGCYARWDAHGNTGVSKEPRGDELVSGILDLVARHDPIHVSLVGGEPLLRQRELDIVLPRLSERGINTMVVTSGVLPIPLHWNDIPRVVVCVSVDGLAVDHDVRRAPATYERILQNISGRKVNVHWTVVRSAMRDNYCEEYLDFWSAMPEVGYVLVSTYTPQHGERTAEMLTADDRRRFGGRLPELKRRYPKLLMFDEMAAAFQSPPPAPDRCLFSRMSRAYTSDLTTEVAPCVIGGDVDCSQCGCSIAMALQGVAAYRIRGPLHVRHLIAVTTAIAEVVSRVRRSRPPRLVAEPANAALKIGTATRPERT